MRSFLELKIRGPSPFLILGLNILVALVMFWKGVTQPIQSSHAVSAWGALCCSWVWGTVAVLCAFRKLRSAKPDSRAVGAIAALPASMGFTMSLVTGVFSRSLAAVPAALSIVGILIVTFKYLNPPEGE
jgi:CHASE2 domain-containing sensor protein